MVHFSVDGTPIAGTATANASGVWTFTPSGLADGTHTIMASETDVAGNTGTASFTFTLDTTAPVAPSITAFSTDSGVVGDHITNDNTPTLTGTAEANSTVNVYDGATLLGTAAANGSGAWSYTTTALTDGNHAFTATDTDAAGNISAASTAMAITIDTTAPAAPSITSDAIVNTNEVALTGTAGANSAVSVFDGATLLGSATADSSGDWNFTTGTLASGTHSFTATDTDAAGNASVASSVLDVSVDLQSSIADTVNSLIINSRGTGLLTGTSEANSAISINDGNTGASLSHATTSATGAWNVIMANLSNAVHNLIVTASDQAGNTGSVHVVSGTTGNDTLTNSAPNEIFFGNGGNDTFVFSGNIGHDTIADFNATNDVLQLSQNTFTNFAAVLAHATQAGSDVTITIDPSNSITLHNTELAQLTSQNVHLV